MHLSTLLTTYHTEVEAQDYMHFNNCAFYSNKFCVIDLSVFEEIFPKMKLCIQLNFCDTLKETSGQ